MRSPSVSLEGQSSFTMSWLNLNWKILSETTVSQLGRSIIFHHVQAKSELKDFRWDHGQADGGSIIFHHVLAKSELKHFRWDPIQSDWESIIFHHVQAKSALKNVRWDPIQSDGGGTIIFHHVLAKSELKNFKWDHSESTWEVNHLSPFQG